MSSEFCSKFFMLSSSAKILEIGQDSTKLQTVDRWELFLRHSVHIVKVWRSYCSRVRSRLFRFTIGANGISSFLAKKILTVSPMALNFGPVIGGTYAHPLDVFEFTRFPLLQVRFLLAHPVYMSDICDACRERAIRGILRCCSRVVWRRGSCSGYQTRLSEDLNESGCQIRLV